MDSDPRSRRAFLGLAAAGAATLAGCALPQTDRSITGNSSTVDPDSLADGSAYSAVYAEIIDAVTQVRVFGLEDPVTGEEGRGGGSGFLIDESHIVTNDHVVRGSEAADVQYVNGDWATTSLAGTDYYSDLAVLEVDHVPSDSDPLSFSDEQPVPGQEVMAIGYPYGLEGSISTGIVSGVNRSLSPPNRSFAFPNVVQTDAAVNPGNSGGPLVDLQQQVIGVVNATGGENVGFAISAALAQRVVPSLIETGDYKHSFMGITLVPVDRLVAEANDLSSATGVLVNDVTDEPAVGSLEPSEGQVTRHGQPIPVGGDVIIAIDGEPIPDNHALSTYLALETSPGDTIAVTVLRQGAETVVDMTLAKRPAVA
ncbi:MAG: trypsin-like peptidase domain-containing protein [Natrialbaceae archaeon]|nr:trypsin-like peptidase domain-containing protein [Natrialbaceae archaeon]